MYFILDSSTSTDQNDPNKDKSKTPKSKDMHLPISRVRTIMKSTPDIENIGLPSLHVVTKATVRIKSFYFNISIGLYYLLTSMINFIISLL